MSLSGVFPFWKSFGFSFVFCCNFLMAYDFQKIQPEIEKIANKNDIQEFRSYMKLAMSKLTHELPLDAASEPCVKKFYQKISNGCTLPETGWAVYPSFIKAASALRKIGTGIDDPSFQVEKRKVGNLSEETNHHLYMSLGKAKTTPLLQSDIRPEYRSILGLAVEEEERWNRSCQFLLLENEQLKHLQTTLDELKEDVSKCIGSPWRVVNVRSWNSRSQELQAERIGSGIPDSVYTLFLYPTKRAFKGSWVLFKNREVNDSSFLPLQHDEENPLIVEITLIPALEYDTRPVEAGLLAIYPILPWTNLDKPKTVYPKGIGLNIGAGRSWQYQDWISLERSGDGNGCSFVLSPNCRFPLENESIWVAYSCHVLEHLDDATVFRVLLETRRVLIEEGCFIIKIPNFDEVLDAWRTRDHNFFANPYWGFPTNLWSNLGVADSLDARAAFIFSSFGSPELNGLFSGQEYLDHPRAYYGPPLVSDSYLQDLIRTGTPHEIAFELRKCILRDQKGTPDLSHQNAWSPEELKSLLTLFGFEVVTFDREKIVNIWPHLSWMRDAWHTSTFCMAKKKTAHL